MSEQQTAAPDAMSMELVKVTTGVEAIQKIEAGLADLRRRYAGVVFEVTTTEGMDAAKAARLAIREPRYEVERIRKAAKAPVLALGKQIDSVAARITEAIESIEAPIHLQILTEENRKEDEKQARINAEIKRVADIRARIEELRGCQMLTPASGSKLILQHVDDLSAIPLGTFEEFEQEAFNTKCAALARLNSLAEAAARHEDEQRKLAEERAELAKQKAEQAERERLAAEQRLAEQQRLDLERIENERIAQREATLNRQRQEELDRQAEEQRQRNAAEEQRLADQRAELERQQAELVEAQKPKAAPVFIPLIVTEPAAIKPRVLALPCPGRDALVAAVADYFIVDKQTAAYWLHTTFQSSEVAA